MDNFDDDLRRDFPLMFPGGDIGLWVGPGWQHVVRSLCHNIQYHIDVINSRRAYLLANNPDHDRIPDEVPQVVVAQIKEKFGSLRFYYDGGDDYIGGLVTMAESWAHRTCEDCGQPGMLRQDLRWVKVLCDDHHQQRKAAHVAV